MADVVKEDSTTVVTTAIITTTVENVNATSTASSSDDNNNDEKLRKLLKPAPTPAHIQKILWRYYHESKVKGVIHILKQLDSYDDCNYQVVIGDDMYLLKITNGLESRDYIHALSSSTTSIIEFQHTIMNALHENHIGTTIPVKPFMYDDHTIAAITNSRKRSIETMASDDVTTSAVVVVSSPRNSGTHSKDDVYVILEQLPVVSKPHSPTLLAVRLYVWLRGQPMSTIPHHRLSLHTLVNVGQHLGHIHHVLDQIKSIPSATTTTNHDEEQMSCLPQHRYHQWDTKNTYDLVSFTQYIPDVKRRSMIESILDTFRAEILTNTNNNSNNNDTATNVTTTVASKFRRGIIMGDYNDANIVLDADSLQFNGVIDFGDSVESWRVLDITVAMAYAMLTTYGKCQHASISSMAAMLRGYHSIYPLTSLEREHLILLVVCRLACSVTLGAYSLQQNPENETYLSLHAKPAWDALELLWGYDVERRQQMKHVLNQILDQACSYSVTLLSSKGTALPREMIETPPSYDLAFPDPTVVDPFVSIRKNK